MATTELSGLVQVDPFRWRLPKGGRMLVDGLVYLDRPLIELVGKDLSLSQVANVAALPGIVGHSLAMPDVHQGYGFPIGGVAAFRPDTGIVSPGGVGYDINCGVRLLRSSLRREDLAAHAGALLEALFARIPSGVGSQHQELRLGPKALDEVLRHGAAWAVRNGFGVPADLAHIENGGCLDWADPGQVSRRALERGHGQLGTLGSGNHFVEVGYVDRIYDPEVAEAFGLFQDQMTVFIHTGSRGLGHQVCDDAIRQLAAASRRYGIALPDRELCCAPIGSPEGQAYLAAMAAAANFAFANRQLITQAVRDTVSLVFGLGAGRLGLDLVYDVCHNIAKKELHEVAGKTLELIVHRKGATRAFPAGHPEVPEAYRQVGQPVLIPGDMGRASYVLVGTPRAMSETFGSACHGAGRVLSRHAAIKAARGRNVVQELAAAGVLVRGASRGTVVEEMPEAYKDVQQVVHVVHEAGLARKVARLKPVVVIKG
ncbi:MAG: RtcB family protein [Thermodesulfobacteriota bacterium]